MVIFKQQRLNLFLPIFTNIDTDIATAVISR